MSISGSESTTCRLANWSWLVMSSFMGSSGWTFLVFLGEFFLDFDGSSLQHLKNLATDLSPPPRRDRSSNTKNLCCAL